MKKEVTIINLTPHDIVLYINDKPVLYESQGVVRANCESELVGTINGINVYKNKYTSIDKMPKYKKGTYYIVSRIVAEIMRNRKDLLLANETVRDDKGQIIGCKSFSRL